MFHEVLAVAAVDPHLADAGMAGGDPVEQRGAGGGVLHALCGVGRQADNTGSTNSQRAIESGTQDANQYGQTEETTDDDPDDRVDAHALLRRPTDGTDDMTKRHRTSANSPGPGSERTIQGCGDLRRHTVASCGSSSTLATFRASAATKDSRRPARRMLDLRPGYCRVPPGQRRRRADQRVIEIAKGMNPLERIT